MISGSFVLNRWHKLHEAITLNNQYKGIANLLERVRHFMDTVFIFIEDSYVMARGERH